MPNDIDLVVDALNNISQGLLILDSENRVLYANNQYHDFYPLATKYLKIGMLFKDLISDFARDGTVFGPNDFDKEVNSRVQPVLNRQTFALDRQIEDGRYLFITGAPSPSGGYIFTFTDITNRVTEQERLEKLVSQRTQELKAANKQLTLLATKDALTGVSNRRKFDDTLEAEWARALRNESYLGLIMIDIDYFKKYNDHYGHLLGDECLIKVSGKLNEMVTRPGDMLARYGGEEFAVILPSTPLDGVQKLAQNICTSIHDLASPHTQSPFEKVTVSLGIASIIPDKTLSPENLISIADQGLYEAKNKGRNQVASHHNHSN